MTAETTLDVSDATFAHDVLDRSHERPVIVDFWAPWCGPCRVLGPVLEELAEEYQGRLQLTKLNTDENPQTASQFEIQGIPAVIAFRDGESVRQFVGALPEPQVREFFEAVAPSQADLKLSEARQMLAQDQRGAARLHLESALQEQPAHEGAALALGVLLAEEGEFERAQELVAPWPGAAEAKTVTALAGFRQAAEGADAAALEARLTADENDAEAHYLRGVLAASQGAWAEALEHLLSVVRLDRELREDAGRLRMLEIFTILGDGDEMTQEYRRRLGAVLF